ncbi:hypothetical protein PAMA_017210 [Pampus argenteus]
MSCMDQMLLSSYKNSYTKQFVQLNIPVYGMFFCSAGLTDRLLQKQQTDYNEVIENIFSEVSGLEEYSKILDPQLEECAIQLWNWAVTKNVGTTISKSQKAKVRHVACSLLYCCEPENPTEGIIRKQILSLETLYSQLTSRGDSAADVSSSKGDVEKDLLRILSCQAESTVYLSLMCYNFGVDTYNLKKFEDSAFWLREVLAFEYLKRVGQHFESSPDLGSALVLHNHYTGKQLSPQALTRLHAMLWDKASKHFEDRNYSEALQWYNYSLNFFKAGQMDSNLAKLQRNRASCFLQLKQLEKGKQAIKEAERCDPDSIFTQFSVYKIAVQENNVEKAAEALNAMGRLSKSPLSSEDKLLVSENAASSLLSLAAQIALENEQQDTAMKALESLCEHSRDEAQVLTALRCLVRLVLSTIERSSDGMRNVNLDVLLPYLKMAWNSALQCESSPDRMRDFFVLSYQASALISFDKLFNQYLQHSIKCVHSLIKLSLPSGVLEVEAHVLEEVWCYYEEALSIIAASLDDFPEMEILWLLTRAWNTGILLYSLAEYPEAEKWCRLAMSFVHHLGSLQESYEMQMSGLYSEILDRLDKAKRNLIMEE